MGVPGKKNQEPSPLEDHLRAKFHPDPSSHLDFYREQTDRQTDTHTHTDMALYVLEDIKFASDWIRNTDLEISEATTLSTEPQPLPLTKLFSHNVNE